MKRRSCSALLVLLGGLAACAPAASPWRQPRRRLLYRRAAAARATVDPAPPQGPAPAAHGAADEVHVELDVETNDTKLAGSVTIDLTLASADRRRLASRQKPRRARCPFRGGRRTLPARVVIDAKNERLGFVTSQRSMPAGRARLFVRYDAEVLENSDRGVFREQEGGDWYVFSQFENTEARSAFPCFDEPNVKTPWSVTLEVGRIPSGARQHAADLASRRRARAARRYVSPRPSPCRPISWPSRSGPSISSTRGKAGQAKIPVRIATPRGAAREAAYAAQITADLLGVLEDYFGIPYPYDKLDVVPVPTLITWGAMENAGLITFFREGMLAQPGEDSEAFKRRYADIMAHEIAHQWFGDLVTMQWWDDIWLNEGFATWMTNKVVAKYRPEWNIDVARVRDDSQGDGQRLARERAPHPPAHRIARRHRQRLRRHHLRKGRGRLGDVRVLDRRRKVPPRHPRLSRSGTPTATPPRAISSPPSAKKPASTWRPAFSSFLDQPGVPLVAPASECKPGTPKLALAQERYLPLGSKGDPARTWIVPVCMRSATSRAGRRRDRPPPSPATRSAVFSKNRKAKSRSLEVACSRRPRPQRRRARLLHRRLHAGRARRAASPR